MGHPILRKVAQKVKPEVIKTRQFQDFIQDLQDSMKHYGGIGIAAPQVGESLQVCVIELESINRYGEEVHLPFTVFINPEIEYLTEEQQGFWEGCLSVPGLRGFVERPQKIKVKYLDGEGLAQELTTQGFLATVIQHELDHLFGTLYIDRIKDPKLLTYQEEFEKFIQNAETLD
jgi:peptide deformylase